MNLLGSKTKTIEIEGRKFQINKFTAFTGLKIAKMFVAKVLPLFQSFLPMISQAMRGNNENSGDIVSKAKEDILSELDKFLNFEGISRALDMVSPDDLDYILANSLRSCYEILPAGAAAVMNADGTYGVPDIEYDMLLVLRLVCEAILWGVGDFFVEGRLGSIMSPLSSSLPLSQ